METGAERFDKDLWAARFKPVRMEALIWVWVRAEHHDGFRVKFAFRWDLCSSLVSSLNGWFSLRQSCIKAFWCSINVLFQFLMNSIRPSNRPWSLPSKGPDPCLVCQSSTGNGKSIKQHEKKQRAGWFSNGNNWSVILPNFIISVLLTVKMVQKTFF